MLALPRDTLHLPFLILQVLLPLFLPRPLAVCFSLFLFIVRVGSYVGEAELLTRLHVFMSEHTHQWFLYICLVDIHSLHCNVG